MLGGPEDEARSRPVPGLRVVLAADVLGEAVQGISYLNTASGEVNVDLADVKAIMTDTGMALMGIGAVV